MERIPQSVAIRVPLLAYLASDHVTPATGKTIAITISKNGAAFGNPSGGATNATEVGSGLYYVDLSTTDTGTVGPVAVKGTEGTIDQVMALYDVAAFQAFPTNFSALAITAGGAVTAGTVSDKTGYALTAAYDAAKTAAQAGDAMTLTGAYDAAKTAITTGGVLTESYRANGAEGTAPQLLYELIAHLGESAIVGTTKTINKVDHSTAAETFTLDDASTPTSITRAS